MPDLRVLFRPYRLNTLDLPNRVVMAPMTRSFSPGGTPTEEVASYYQRRAAHGVGLIITEGVGVDRPDALNEPNLPYFHGETALAGWKKVVDAVHAAGGRIAPQLWHVGQKRSRAAGDWVPPAPYESPSGLSMAGEPIGHAMTDGDIADTIQAFARAAADAERLGFDGAEVHGAHNYLVNQFFDDELNRRVDRYGGPTLIARSRFAVDVLKAMRAVVSPGFPIILRLSQWKPHDFEARLASTPQALEQWLGLFVDAGVDAFDLSQADFSAPAFPEADPALNLAGWAKRLTGVTSITVGSVGLSGGVYQSFKGHPALPVPLDEMVARLERDEFDLVAVGRPLLQDPAWLEKVRTGRLDQDRAFTAEEFASLS